MKTFGFTIALSYLMQGKKVRRHDWHREAWMEVSGDSIVDENEEDFCGMTNSSDILADDWELVE